VLLIKVEQDVKLNCGKNWQIQKGLYAYIGSAMNSLEKRICRHLRQQKRYHWHIDYLLKTSTILSIFIFPGQRNELRFSQEFAKHFDGPEGFGSSDLPVRTNLYRIDDLNELSALLTKLYGVSNHPAAEL